MVGRVHALSVHPHPGQEIRKGQKVVRNVERQVGQMEGKAKINEVGSGEKGSLE